MKITVKELRKIILQEVKRQINEQDRTGAARVQQTVGDVGALSPLPQQEIPTASAEERQVDSLRTTSRTAPRAPTAPSTAGQETIPVTEYQQALDSLKSVYPLVGRNVIQRIGTATQPDSLKRFLNEYQATPEQVNQLRTRISSMINAANQAATTLEQLLGNKVFSVPSLARTVSGLRSAAQFLRANLVNSLRAILQNPSQGPSLLGEMLTGDMRGGTIVTGFTNPYLHGKQALEALVAQVSQARTSSGEFNQTISDIQSTTSAE